MAREGLMERAADIACQIVKALDVHPNQANIEAVVPWVKYIRQKALREAASKLVVGDCDGLLNAPCLWCGYNGSGYYQAGTHDQSCVWHMVGGHHERLARLASEGG